MLYKVKYKLCSIRNCGSDVSLEALVASKLIPLDKNSGVRLIGIDEVIRRINGSAVKVTFHKNILECAGDLQSCPGQRSRFEAAIHALSSIFNGGNYDAVLIVDTDNAFNRLNRKVMLHNTRITCPIIATCVINTYNHQARVFIGGGDEIISREGTTHGGPAAVTICTLGSLPLLDTLLTQNTKQAAYADNLSCADNVHNLAIWRHKVNKLGPKIGYFREENKP